MSTKRTGRLCLSVAALVIATPALLLRAAAPSLASWTSTNCSPYHYADSIFQRKTSQSYASVADNEGYEWGGGCWNNNNVDDTPNAPDSGGEGPDCSGYTFKSWELPSTGNGGEYWDKLENVHGPYASYDFHSPVGTDPFYAVAKSSMVYMDAFAKDGHVAMLSSKADSSSNYAYVWEAYGDASGTDENYRDYPSNSLYTGARRENWTADCYPNCAAPGAGATRVISVP